MFNFREELIKSKGKRIRFQTVTGQPLNGEVREVGSDSVLILVSDPEQEKGSKLYNLTNIVWVQSYGKYA